MEISALQIATKLQKYQNSRDFRIFHVFIQLWIFTLTTNIWNAISNLAYCTIYCIRVHIWAPEGHRLFKSIGLLQQEFGHFLQNFSKNAIFQMRFSQWRNEIFNFSGRFSESSNDFLSQESRPTGAYLNAYWCKIASKHRGSWKTR